MSDFIKLQPHMYKPCVSKEYVKENCPQKELPDSEEDTNKIGNNLWCSCGKCKPVDPYAESICCFKVVSNVYFHLF